MKLRFWIIELLTEHLAINEYTAVTIVAACIRAETALGASALPIACWVDALRSPRLAQSKGVDPCRAHTVRACIERGNPHCPDPCILHINATLWYLGTILCSHHIGAAERVPLPASCILPVCWDGASRCPDNALGSHSPMWRVAREL